MKDKKNTQAGRVLAYIRDFGSITRLEAMLDLGVANLPAVIDTLRHKWGIPIVTEEVESLNRYQQKITYALYRIEESEDTVSGN